VSLRIALLAGHFRVAKEVMLVKDETQTFITFKVCKSVHHRTAQINHQPHATIFQFIILTFMQSLSS
jgi:hypothetical protein